MKKIVLLLLFTGLFLGGLPLWGGAADLLSEPWVWSVAVVPPPEGWLAEKGVAIRAGLLLLQRRLNEPAEGVRGFDVIFTWDEPLPPGAVAERVESWRRERRVAVLSFASAETDRALALALGREGPPLIVAGGEDLPLRDASGSPCPYLFALSQERAFRANAVADYALLRGSRIMPLLSDSLDSDLLRSHNVAIGRIESRGLPVLSLLFRSSSDDALLARADEVLATGAPFCLFFLDPLAALDFWAMMQRRGHTMELYFGDAFHPSLMAAKGLLFADQDYPLRMDPQLALFKDELWLEEGLRVIDLPSASRAYALGSWLARALEAAGPEAAPLAEALAEVDSIPLGSRILDIDSRTHRPRSAVVALLEIGGDGGFIEKGFIDVRSFEVVEGILPSK